MITFYLLVLVSVITLISAFIQNRKELSDERKAKEESEQRNLEYKSLLKKTNQLLEEQGKALQVMTGGDSFCYFNVYEESGRTQYQLIHKSHDKGTGYTLYGVRAVITRCPKNYKISESSFFNSLDLETMPTVPPPKGEPTNDVYRALYEVQIGLVQGLGEMLNVDFEKENLLIKFKALNGEWTQLYTKDLDKDSTRVRYLIAKKTEEEPLILMDSLETY